MPRAVLDVNRSPAPARLARPVPGLEPHGAFEALGVARCPCCHAPLVVRVDSRGPYFQCLCAEGAFGVRRP